MSLRTRLQHLAVAPTSTTLQSKTSGSSPPGRALTDAVYAPRLLECAHALTAQHGEVALGHARHVDPRHLARLALDPEVVGVDLAHALYLDTETTGLAGGSGTLPFLIGLGFFTDSSDFQVEQLLVPEPGQEEPALRHLAQRLTNASCLVTYNGKSFDWPLLRTRFVLNRLPAPRLPVHVDLLHVARRVYRRRLGEVRLGNVEREVLGFTREGDIDGSEIPQRFFDFLRQRDWDLLAPVISHNALDILALVALLARLGEHYQDPTAARDARDQLGLAKVASRARDDERATRFADAAANEGRGQDGIDALLLLATLHRQQGRHRAAANALERCLDLALPTATAPIHLALAKLYEHRLRQPDVAIEHARAAMTAEPHTAHERRLERLTRRIGAL